MENFLNYSGKIEGYPEALVLYMIEQHLSQHGDETIAEFEQNGFLIIDWSKTPQDGSYWINIFEKKDFDKFLMDFNKDWTLGDFYHGRVALVDNGTLEELQTVLKHVFPNDNAPINRNYKFYVKHDQHRWNNWNDVFLPRQSVKTFLKQITVTKVWTLEDLRLGKCAAENDSTLEELNLVLKSVFGSNSIVGYSKYYYISLDNAKNWAGSDSTLLPKQSIKTFLKQIPIPEIWTLEDLCSGKCALVNDGTPDEIQTVLNWCFPMAKNIYVGFRKYYKQNLCDTKLWSSSDTTDLPKQSVKLFLEQLPVKISEPYLSRKQLVELYHLDGCYDWKSGITNYLNKLVHASDDKTIKISSDDISIVFQKGTSNQKNLLIKYGLIVGLLNLSKYPNGFYRVTTNTDSFNIEKISDKIIRKIGEDKNEDILNLLVFDVTSLELVTKQ